MNLAGTHLVTFALLVNQPQCPMLLPYMKVEFYDTAHLL